MRRGGRLFALKAQYMKLGIIASSCNTSTGTLRQEGCHKCEARLGLPGPALAENEEDTMYECSGMSRSAPHMS